MLGPVPYVLERVNKINCSTVLSDRFLNTQRESQPPTDIPRRRREVSRICIHDRLPINVLLLKVYSLQHTLSRI